MELTYRFRDASLAALALTHRSAGKPNNERMEFLGDALLGAILAIYGLATGSDGDLYKSSLTININLWWGLVLFVFGALMLAINTWMFKRTL